MQIALLALAFGSIADPALAGDQQTGTPLISKRMSEAILTGFKPAEVERPVIFEETVATTDPGVVVLREFEVRGRREVEFLTPGSLIPPTQATPVTLGSGITEYRGKKYMVLTQRLLFIPFGLKITW